MERSAIAVIVVFVVSVLGFFLVTVTVAVAVADGRQDRPADRLGQFRMIRRHRVDHLQRHVDRTALPDHRVSKGIRQSLGEHVLPKDFLEGPVGSGLGMDADAIDHHAVGLAGWGANRRCPPGTPPGIVVGIIIIAIVIATIIATIIDNSIFIAVAGIANPLVLQDANDRLGKIRVLHKGMGDQKDPRPQVRRRSVGRKRRHKARRLLGEHRFRAVAREPVVIREFLVELPEGRKGDLLPRDRIKVHGCRRRCLRRRSIVHMLLCTPTSRSTIVLWDTARGTKLPLEDGPEPLRVGLRGEDHFAVAVRSRHHLAQQPPKEALVGPILRRSRSQGSACPLSMIRIPRHKGVPVSNVVVDSRAVQEARQNGGVGGGRREWLGRPEQIAVEPSCNEI
mmetsp:Transcript_157/g.309  ORF Transcript_157/g.309 Transcript_157/m.309 type:complete len:394 (-) Transcript_157:438-1619(-)